MLDAVPGIHVLRDPTRGGLGATLNEIASQSGVGMRCGVRHSGARRGARGLRVAGAGPLYVANEGKLLAICPVDQADALLAAMRAHPQGRDAARIGSVVDDPNRFVQMTTALGGQRMVDWLSGEQLPRIC
jgi:hydrogenase expression/formation protein HypE